MLIINNTCQYLLHIKIYSEFINPPFNIMAVIRNAYFKHIKIKCDSNPMKEEKAKYIIENPDKK